MTRTVWAKKRANSALDNHLLELDARLNPGADTTAKYTGKRLLKVLTTLRQTPDDTLRASVVTLDAHLQSLAAEIASAESAINADIYKLYGLTTEEIRLVESG